MNKKNIKFKTLRKRINIKNIVIGALLITILALVIVNRISHASFTSSLSVPLVNGKINYKYPDFKVMAMFQQSEEKSTTYNEIETMPDPNKYTLNTSKSYCNKGFTEEKDSNVEFKKVDGNHIMNNLTKNDRCFLYFDINVPATSVNDLRTKLAKDSSRSGEITATFTDSTPTTVYSKEDDYGTSYVFAGVNPNNWIKIGNFYFRIIRFNGNGSMRIIYSGSGSAQTSGTGTQIGTKAFNTNHNDNMYVGLQYSNGEVHGTDQNSTILGASNSTDATELYGWYNNNIKSTYGSLIDSSVGFCSDRTHSTSSTGAPENPGSAGTGTTATYYAAKYRYYDGSSWRTTYTPTLKCTNTSDLLKIPVGLLTADEYALAGGGGGSTNANTTFWLHTGQYYWTMSPSYCAYGNAYVFRVPSSGYLSDWVMSYAYGVRPVINLKSSTTFSSGVGTSSDPYVVKI